MNLVRKISTLSLVSLLMLSCGDGKKKEEDVVNTVDSTTLVVEEPEVVESTTIVDIAVENENFSTLVTALQVAELIETLKGDGPFTVFAPTNEAFKKLPAGTVEGLLKPENLEKLKGILTYHVVAGKFEAGAIIDAINSNNGKFTVDTVNGGKMDLSLVDGKVVLTDANGKTATVVMADVAASNGVIHAIDAVVMPK